VGLANYFLLGVKMSARSDLHSYVSTLALRKSPLFSTMIEGFPIDLIVEIGLLTGPDEYEELAKTSKRNAIILQKPYIIKVTNAFICRITLKCGRRDFAYNGKLHSFNDQPAIIWPDGTQQWYRHGEIHRCNDLPADINVDDGNGNRTMRWYRHGSLHRVNGPAVIWFEGSMFWYQYGRLHRDGGLPAVMYPDGRKYYYQNGKPVQ
jgi:hypothetical protein